MRLTAAQRLLFFLTLTFVGSGSLALTFYLSGGEPQTGAARALSFLYTMLPCVVALFVQGAVGKQPLLKPFGIQLPNKWLFVGWFGPVLILCLNLILIGLFTEGEVIFLTQSFVEKMNLPPEVIEQIKNQFLPPIFELTFQGLIAGGTLSAMMVFWEEVGFRGYLYHEMENLFSDRSFWFRSMWMGLIWGLWSMPLSLFGFFPSDFLWGASLLFLWCMVATPLLNYLRYRSESILGSVIFRGSFLALMQIPATVVLGYQAHQMGFYGVTGIGSLLLFFLTILLMESVLKKSTVLSLFRFNASRDHQEAP